MAKSLMASIHRRGLVTGARPPKSHFEDDFKVSAELTDWVHEPTSSLAV